MIDRQRLRSEAEKIQQAIARKRVSAPIEEFLRLDAARRELLTRLDAQKAEQNSVSKSIGALMAQGKTEEANAAKSRAAELKEIIAGGDEELKVLDEELARIELTIPNAPHDSVPTGASEEDNVEVRRHLEPKTFDFEPKAHWDIATALGIIDFAAGAKIAGSGFIVYRGPGARLQRSLINYMVDLHVREHGYTEIWPPLMVNRAAMTGTGQLPKFEEDLYLAERDELFMIPTAEVPVTNLHRDEILEPGQLPLRYVAFSACFRREAGAAGKDTRGLLRVHEFDKVELVKFCPAETSYEELETLTADAETVLRSLGLHFRTVSVCSGEMGFSNAKQYDLEVHAPGVGRYLEVSSASNFEDFQARRANIRYRPEKGAKPVFAHTLNASGVACPRLMAALLETYQREDGSVEIPEPLRPYMGVAEIRR